LTRNEAFTAKFEDWNTKFTVAYKPLVSFTIGAIIGAIVMYKGTFHCMAIALFVVLVIMADIYLQQLAERDAATASESASVQASKTLAAPAPAAASELVKYSSLSTSDSIEKGKVEDAVAYPGQSELSAGATKL